MTLARDNVGVGTKYRSIIELDIAGELPRFIGPVGPPLTRNLPETDVMRGRKVFYDTCAVVGSSGAMLAAERGAEIDAHDVVAHVNSLPHPDLFATLGSRTDLFFGTLCTIEDSQEECSNICQHKLSVRCHHRPGRTCQTFGSQQCSFLAAVFRSSVLDDYCGPPESLEAALEGAAAAPERRARARPLAHAVLRLPLRDTRRAQRMLAAHGRPRVVSKSPGGGRGGLPTAE